MKKVMTVLITGSLIFSANSNVSAQQTSLAANVKPVTFNFSNSDERSAGHWKIWVLP